MADNIGLLADAGSDMADGRLAHVDLDRADDRLAGAGSDTGVRPADTGSDMVGLRSGKADGRVYADSGIAADMADDAAADNNLS